MSEEEIIETLEDIIKNLNGDMIISHTNYNKAKAIQGLLDLYNKEKGKNKELEQYKKYYENEKVVWNRKDYIKRDKIKERLEQTQKVYEEEMKPYLIEVADSERVLNVSYLSKKEKDELLNKRNCLLVQIATYKDLLEEKSNV